MPKITTQEVQKIAGLAKLRLEGTELETLTNDFNEILKFVEQIQQADVSGVEPFDHVLGSTNFFRDDTPFSEIAPENIRNLAPESEAGYFVVPKVIEAGD